MAVRNTEIIEILLAYGADINAQDHYGFTALHKACIQSNIRAVTLLLNRGASVSAVTHAGFTPLLLALSVPTPSLYVEEIAQLLIAAGADLDMTDHEGMTALLYAIKNGFFYTALQLITHGADVNKRATDGSTALLRAVLWLMLKIMKVAQRSH